MKYLVETRKAERMAVFPVGRGRLILMDSDDPTENDNRAIQEACKDGNFQRAESLLKWKNPAGKGRFVDPTANMNKSIRLASARGNLETVKLLLEWSGPRDKVVDPRSAKN